jgi:hypothetical protein
MCLNHKNCANERGGRGWLLGGKGGGGVPAREEAPYLNRKNCEMKRDAFSVATQFTVSTGKRANFREECHWSHACLLQANIPGIQWHPRV